MLNKIKELFNSFSSKVDREIEKRKREKFVNDYFGIIIWCWIASLLLFPLFTISFTACFIYFWIYRK